jgi:hypothetical protein
MVSSNPLGGLGGDSKPPVLPDDLLSDYSRYATRAENWAVDNAHHQNYLWDLGAYGAQQMQNRVPVYGNMANSAADNTLNNAYMLSGDAWNRSAYERSMLRGVEGIPGYLPAIGTSAIDPQMSYARGMMQFAPAYQNQDIINRQIEMSKNLINQANSGNQLDRLVGVGEHLNKMGENIGNQLLPLRGQTLSTLNDVSQGRISPAIQELFTSAGGTRERDILELQMNNARNRLMETSGAQGGLLERNLAALETQRALGLAEQESRRTDQQRQLAANLFGTAMEQGITAPQQEAGLRGQAASVYDLAGKQQMGSLGQLGSNYTAAAGLLQSAEQQRQTGLTGALGALDTAASRDLAARQFYQQSFVQSQQLAQQLAAQYGAGADQINLAFPEMAKQALGMGYLGLTAPFLPAQSLGQIPIGNPMNYLSPAKQGHTDLMATKAGAVNDRIKIQAEQDAATTQAMGSIGTAAIMAAVLT